jgi:hypothetical protein
MSKPPPYSGGGSALVVKQLLRPHHTQDHVQVHSLGVLLLTSVRVGAILTTRAATNRGEN